MALRGGASTFSNERMPIQRRLCCVVPDLAPVQMIAGARNLNWLRLGAKRLHISLHEYVRGRRSGSNAAKKHQGIGLDGERMTRWNGDIAGNKHDAAPSGARARERPAIRRHGHTRQIGDGFGILKGINGRGEREIR